MRGRTHTILLTFTLIILAVVIPYHIGTSPVRAGGITRVQGNARGTSSSSSTISVTLTQTPVSGNLLIATVSTFIASTITTTVTSISETGVTWSIRAGESTNTVSGYSMDVGIWVGVVGSSASTTVTVNLSSASGYGVADICEYSGLATTGFLDKSTSTSGVSVSPSTGTTAITSQANELWIGAIGLQAYSQSTPTNGFTLLDGAAYSGEVSNAYLEKIVSSTGAASSGTTGAGSETWAGVIATFAAQSISGIARVQGDAEGTSASSSTIGVVLAQAPTSGDLLIATVSTYIHSTAAVAITSISETGVTWSIRAVTSTNMVNGYAVDVEIWVGVVGSSASTTVTVNLSSASGYGVADICEYSGLATTGFLDKSTSTSGVSVSPSTGTTAITSQANELWIGAIGLQAYSQSTPTNGFTMLDGATVYGQLSNSYLEKIVSSTGTASSGTTGSGSETWAGAMVAFATQQVSSITRVQGNARGTSSSSSTISVTLTQTPVSGNLLIATVSTFIASTTITTVTSISETGVTWSKQITSTNVVNGYSVYVGIWVGVVGSSASSSVTVSLSAAGGYGVADICEYSGLATTGFLDKSTSTSGVSVSPSTGTTAITSQAAELFIGTTVIQAASQSTPTNGFTSLDGIMAYGEQSNIYLEKIVSSTGAASSGTTASQSETWAGVMATFKVLSYTLNAKVVAADGSTVVPKAYVTMSNSSNFELQVNATGWVKYISITTVSVTLSVQWENTTDSNGWVYGTTTQTMGQNQIVTLITNVYTITPIWHSSNTGLALLNPVTFSWQPSNGTTINNLNSGTAYLVQNKTVTLSNVKWESLAVSVLTPSNSSFNAATGSPTITLSVYQSGSSNNLEFAVDSGTISSITWTTATETESMTVTHSSGSATFKETTGTFTTPTSVKLNSVSQTVNWANYLLTETLTWTGSDSLVITWSVPSSGSTVQYQVLAFDNSTALTAHAYVTLNNGTAYVKAANSTGWVKFTGISTGFEISVQWENSTDINSFVYGPTAFSGTGSIIIKEPTKVYLTTTFSFRYEDNATSFIPTQIQLKASNGTFVTTTSYTIGKMQNGTWTFSQIEYWETDTVPNTNPTYAPFANSQSKVILGQVYLTTPVWKDTKGNALTTNIASYKWTPPNSTLSGSLTPGVGYWVQNGTVTISAVTWNSLDVTPASNTFSPSASSPTFDLNVYKAGNSNELEFAVGGGTISSAVWTVNADTLNLTLVHANGSGVGFALNAGSMGQPNSITVNGASQSSTFTGNVVSASLSFNGNDILIIIWRPITPTLAATVSSVNPTYEIDLSIIPSSTGDYSTFTIARSLDQQLWENLTTTASLSYSDTSASAGTTYYYRVTAYNSITKLDSAWSSTVYATTAKTISGGGGNQNTGASTVDISLYIRAVPTNASISNAIVTIGSTSKSTDANGFVDMGQFNTGSEYSITVTSTGYAPTSATTAQLEANYVATIYMSPTQSTRQSPPLINFNYNGFIASFSGLFANTYVIAAIILIAAFIVGIWLVLKKTKND